MPPAVTVVIPCFNQGHFLSFALRSVQGQSFSDWDAVVVDDGSSDDTRAVAASFPDARIRYQHQENRGLAAARNAGIRAARSPLIALLDADDVWEPEYLRKMCACLGGHPEAAAAYCGFRYIDPLGDEVGRSRTRVVAPDRFHRVLTSGGNWLVPSAVVFRREAAVEAGLFDESLRALEDTDLWIRLSVHRPFVGWPEALVGYRRHPGSMSANPGLMVSAFQQLVEKHQDPHDSQRAGAGERGRLSLAALHRYGALMYLGTRDVRASAAHVRQLFALAPETRGDMGFWRSAIRAHLPLEVRGDTLARSDLAVSLRDILALLDALAAGSALPADMRLLPLTRSRAFLAMAEEGVRSRLWSHAFAWLGRSLSASPGIVLSRPFWGTAARGMAYALRLRGSADRGDSDQPAQSGPAA